MHFSSHLPTILLLLGAAATIHSHVLPERDAPAEFDALNKRTALADDQPVDALAERSVVNGACTGSGGALGVCISTSSCTSGGGKYISNACPGTPDNIKCCTKTSCGSGGNCRFTSSCSGHTLTGLCPGPDNFKCCVPGSGTGGFPRPMIPSVGACKAKAVNGATTIVNANPGKVRQIYCTRDCACPGTSDHCCGMAVDLMCSSAGGVSLFVLASFLVPIYHPSLPSLVLMDISSPFHGKERLYADNTRSAPQPVPLSPNG